jgi:hypothetical protein
MPTDPDTLRDELARRQLTMLGAFVTTRLAEPRTYDRSRRRRSKREAAGGGGDRHPPVHRAVGRADRRSAPDAGRREGGRQILGSTSASGTRRRAASMASHVRCTRRPACAPCSIITAPASSRRRGRSRRCSRGPTRRGRAVPRLGACDLWRRLAARAPATASPDRIWHVHFKDCEPDVARRARDEGWDYQDGAAARRLLRAGPGQRRFRRPAARARGVWLRWMDCRGAGRAARDGRAARERRPEPAVLEGNRGVSRRGRDNNRRKRHAGRCRPSQFPANYPDPDFEGRR